jgi:hypothetical protein
MWRELLNYAWVLGLVIYLAMCVVFIVIVSPWRDRVE